ncbi:TolC family protein [Clostridium chromiireducens]|uniref:Outer membrane efflux protein n=1 Tax=Clostridium chromiireducens TaxID=225345 RepID=A0A1V4J1G2_9CLOT|nr:TolC family protein [Clostridium chromiireducens]OPJ65930.1 outer membrane efflux protein [Clostridium chromiireducens]RII35408.1 TolC family protein [Clostridium chromiireducens]
MRNNINKLVALAIGVSVISGSIVPAFAADTAQNTNANVSTVAQVNGKPILTLQDAINSAISNSDKLKLDDKKITYQDKFNDINENIDDATGVSGDKEDLNSDTRDTTLDQLKQQRDFDEDSLIQKTTTAYNNMVTSQMKIDKSIKGIDVKTKQLNDAKLKQSLGLTTAIDLQSTELQVVSLQNSLKASQNALKDAEYSFKVLTGKDVTQYSLQQDIKYESFKIDGSVDEYLDNIIDTELKYNEKLTKLNKDYFNDKDNEVSEEYVNDAKRTSDGANKPVLDATVDTLEKYEKYVKDYNQYESDASAYTNALSRRLSYLNAKLGVYTAETNLNETKKQLKDTLKTLYTNLLATEDNINYIKQNIDLTNKQLSNAKLKYDLGLMTKSDYDTLVVNSLDLDVQLRTAVDGYNTLKSELQKPWLLSGASGSSNS